MTPMYDQTVFVLRQVIENGDKSIHIEICTCENGVISMSVCPKTERLGLKLVGLFMNLRPQTPHGRSANNSRRLDISC